MSAARGDTICAPATALTASIGIFSIKLDLDRLIAFGVSVLLERVPRAAGGPVPHRSTTAVDNRAPRRTGCRAFARWHGRCTTCVAKSPNAT